MGLSAVVDAISAHLAAAMPSPPARLGPALPTVAADLPAVTVSMSDASRPVRSLGAVPGPVMEGALRVTSAVDLAAPEVVLGGEAVGLLSADRRTLQIPHGSVVRADAIPALPFSTDDLTVRLGATTFTPVSPPPASATQVGLDPATGILTFRDPLPAAGTVQLEYFVGTWEVRAERYRATLAVQVFAASATAVAGLSSDVEDALAAGSTAAATGFRSVEPLSVGTIGPVANLAGAFGRTLDYAVEFEHIQPLIHTGGGPIREIRVTGTPTEPFAVT